MELSDIKTKADVITFVMERDTENYINLTEIDEDEKPIAAFCYYVANYDFNIDHPDISPETIAEQVEMLKRIFTEEEFTYSEWGGGCSFNGFIDMYRTIIEFNYYECDGEYADYVEKCEALNAAFPDSITIEPEEDFT